MARTPKDVTNAELAVLEMLWKQAPATVRQITDQLYPSCNASDHATVQKLLQRLESKGYVSRESGGRAWLFSAIVDRQGLIGRQLQATADKLCEGSLAPLLTHLVNKATLSTEDLLALRNLVNTLSQKKKDR